MNLVIVVPTLPTCPATELITAEALSCAPTTMSMSPATACPLYAFCVDSVLLALKHGQQIEEPRRLIEQSASRWQVSICQRR
jgi:hypothetical protein